MITFIITQFHLQTQPSINSNHFSPRPMMYMYLFTLLSQLWKFHMVEVFPLKHIHVTKYVACFQKAIQYCKMCNIQSIPRQAFLEQLSAFEEEIFGHRVTQLDFQQLQYAIIAMPVDLIHAYIHSPQRARALTAKQLCCLGGRSGQ